MNKTDLLRRCYNELCGSKRTSMYSVVKALKVPLEHTQEVLALDYLTKQHFAVQTPARVPSSKEMRAQLIELTKNELDRLHRVACKQALRWTGDRPVERDVLPPDASVWDGRTEGWDYNVSNREVWKGWSTRVSHGRDEWRASGSQNSRAYFSTKKLALQALRQELELRVAGQLLEVDQKIAAEEDKPY